MSTHPRLPSPACADDHLFVCPRKLCERYMRLLDMFARDDCVAPGHLAALPSNQSEPSESSQQPALPDEAWVLPRPPLPMSTQWYFFREYGGRQSGCVSWMNSSTCCGTVREFVLFYALAKRDSRGAGYLTCEMFWRPLTILRTNRAERAQSAALCSEWSGHFRSQNHSSGP